MSSNNNALLQNKLEKIKELKNKILGLQKLFELNIDLFITTTQFKQLFFNFKISEIENIELLKNYHKFLIFCKENILDKFLIDNYKINIDKLTKEFLKNPIQTFNVDVENLTTKEKEFIDENHTFYSNMIPNFFEKYKEKKKNCK